MKPPRATLFRSAAALAALALGAAAVPAVSQSARAAAPAASAVPTAEAQWIDRTTVVWKAEHTAGTVEELNYADGGTLRLAPAVLTDAQKAAYPHLAGRPAYRLDPRDRDKAATALRGPLAAVQRAADDHDHVLHRTGVQTPGVLDDLYADRARRARLGPVFHGGRPTLSVWAPTAHSVSLDLDGRTVAMRRDPGSGVWSVTGDPGWRDKPYRYRVRVWAPSVGETVTNEVTDPYSTVLTADSTRSLVTDLADPRLAPAGWDALKKPRAVPLRDARIQELQIRDFSIADRTSAHPGQYLAFTDRDADGMRHLARLAKSGTSYVHLLPAFDFGTVPERRSDQARPNCDLAALPADSDRQQKCVAETAAGDGYNWGYDPLHYTVPEGSYASDPDGPARTREFRQMVQGLAHAGLRTVMDVVYNHTVAAGQDDKSVLDRIVPGYYQRLLDDGGVATSTCCPGTAPEHAMMGKLVVDSIVTWARQYKVDGFRFDLMGHHPKANILAVRKALDALTPAKDGVDGKSIILYGEGWNFGEAADDARFVQATQRNMAGTGIATFSDRARDAVRGGGPFDEDPRVQGFASGLFTDPNGSPANGTPDEQRARLLHAQDLIKVGLRLHRHRRTPGQGLRGGLQRRTGRLCRRPRRRARLRRRPRQRDPLRRACLQAPRADTGRRPRPGAGGGPGHRHPLPGPGAQPGRHRSAALEVAGPQLLRQRRLVQRHSLGLRVRQRLRPGTAPGGGQRAQVGLRQAPVDQPGGTPRLPRDHGRLGGLPGSAADPHHREGVQPDHGGGGAAGAVLPAVRDRGDTGRHHHAARPARRGLQRHPVPAVTDRPRSGRNPVRPSPGPGTRRRHHGEEVHLRTHDRHLHRPRPHGGRLHGGGRRALSGCLHGGGAVER